MCYLFLYLLFVYFIVMFNGPLSWARVCHFATPDLNLISLLLLLLNAEADVEQPTAPLIVEKGREGGGCFS